MFQARKVAQDTRTLPMDAAAAVDRRLAPVVRECSRAEIERQDAKTRAEHDPRRPSAAASRLRRSAAPRCTTAASPPTAWFPSRGTRSGRRPRPRPVPHHTSATLDPSIPLDARRSVALGMLNGGGTQAPQELVLYTHARPNQRMVEVENTRTGITPEQVREWCPQAGTRVTLRPVLDLAEEISTGAYRPPPLLKEQAQTQHPRCVFPTCERPSRACDLDHRDPCPLGATTTSSPFPLCRRHHRVKTTGGWTYRPLDPSTIEWTSPTGYRYLRHLR